MPETQLGNICIPLIFLISCLGFSNARTSVIDDFKLCLDSNRSNTTVILVTQNDNPERYNLFNYQWNTISEIHPLAYIIPKSREDVQNAVWCGKHCNIRMYPKSGGHSYEKYSFGDSRSVVLDLRDLSAIRINDNARTARIGSGALLSKIYSTLWTNGKYGIPSASCTGLGIGGVTLGGGYGFWSKKFGLTSDTVIAMEFVDPQGDLLKVNRHTHEDLFWALLGGGLGNFGVVTQFEFKLFDAGALRVNRISFQFDVNWFEQIFQAFQLASYNDRNGTSYIGMKITEQNINFKIISSDMSDADVRNIVDKLPAQRLQTVSNKSMNFMELTLENSTPNAKSLKDLRKITLTSTPKHDYSAKSYFCSKRLNRKEILQLKPSLTSVPPGIFLQFGSFGGSVNLISRNKTSFVHRDSLYLLQVGMSPPDQQPDTLLQQENWLKEFEKAAKILDNGESYQNYVDGELRNDFLQRYYGDNLSRLIKIKRKIDPDNYFAYEQSIPPK